MNKIKLFLAFASLFLAFSAFAQDKFSISAIVNDFVITDLDVENRTGLLFLDSGLTRNDENRQKLERISRGQLIEEVLQLQQVTELGVTVSRTALRNLIKRLESRNNLPEGGFRELMQQNGIDYSHFLEQQRLRLAWNSFLRREFQGSGGISKEEVDNYIEQVKARKGGQEVRLREIFLPYSSPLLIAKTNALAEDILLRLSNGADFGVLANSFSASRSASDGGDIGWVPLNFLDDRIREAVVQLKEGEVSPLIESLTGVTLVKLEGMRIFSSDALASATDEKEVERNLRNKKIDLLHRQTLHRLKSDAFIELR